MLGLTELYDPLRRPDWRARRVHEILTAGPKRQPSRELDDGLVWDYWRFRSAWNAAEHQDRQQDIQLACCEVYYAHRLDQDHQTDLPAIVEARLLAGQDDPAIARSVGTLPEAITCYEQLFFNVRDRLEVEDWIVQVVLAGELRETGRKSAPSATEHRRMLYRLAGYAGGQAALEQVLGGSRKVARSATSLAGNWCEQELFQTLRFKGLQAARLIEVTPDNAAAIVAMTLKLVELDQRERLAADHAGTGESTPLLELARSVLGNMKLMMGDDAVRELPPELQAVLGSPVELRMRDQRGLTGNADEIHGRQLELETGIDEQRGREDPRLIDRPMPT